MSFSYAPDYSSDEDGIDYSSSFSQIETFVQKTNTGEYTTFEKILRIIFGIMLVIGGIYLIARIINAIAGDDGTSQKPTGTSATTKSYDQMPIKYNMATPTPSPYQYRSYPYA
jgi:hypothetical protein